MKIDNKEAIQQQLKLKKQEIRQKAKEVELGLVTMKSQLKNQIARDK